MKSIARFIRFANNFTLCNGGNLVGRQQSGVSFVWPIAVWSHMNECPHGEPNMNVTCVSRMVEYHPFLSARHRYLSFSEKLKI